MLKKKTYEELELERDHLLQELKDTVNKSKEEEKILKQQLIQAEKLSSIGTFMACVAHELNNALTGILAYSEMLMDREGEIPPDIVNDLKAIEKQSKRAAGITKNLLEFSKEHKPEKTVLQVNNTIDNALDLQEYRFRRENIEVQREYSNDVPLVEGNVNHLEQVFLNIIMNAQNSMSKKQGKGVLKIKIEHKENEVHIIFENNGPPIPEERIQNIFDPFYTSKAAKEGTGLGLYVSVGIIKDHGGKIWVENIENTGVRFIVTLPITNDELKKDVTKPSELSLPKKLRLLFVEDEEVILNLFQKLLHDQGIAVQVAKNGKEAVGLIEKGEFDIIFSDVLMPQMGGLELGKWLVENRPEYLKRFVLVTGAIQGSIEEYCTHHGCRYLTKPFSKEHVFEIIRRVAGE